MNTPPMVALYYWYVHIPKDSLQEHCNFHRSLCTGLNLHGRIRISEDGLNGVLTGQKCDLECYEAELKKGVMLILQEQGDGTSCSQQTSLVPEDQTAYGKVLDVKYCHLREDIPVEKQMFTSLSIKITREVVSLNEISAIDQHKNAHRSCIRKGRGRSKRLQQGKIGARSVIMDDTLDPATATREHTLQTEPPSLIMRDVHLDKYEPARHLTPQEWNEKLLKDSALVDSNAVLIDARNVYESNIGHFKVKGVDTILTNTRKYSTITSVLKASIPNLAGKNVYMYCTGGVRCERASVYLQALSDSSEWPDGLDKPKGIYQLQGGIQKYLETYGKRQLDGETPKDNEEIVVTDDHHPNKEEEKVSPGPCLFAGKNFVFDNRRYDPVIGSHEETIGRCVMCHALHDDYDNGHAPCDNKEARCCRCRVLVLVCDDCRCKVRSWGEAAMTTATSIDDDLPLKADLFCGGTKNICVNEGNEISHCQVKTY